jgi:hypothetical protein
MPFLLQETKCKVFKVILHDLEGNWCKMMALVYLHMPTNVTTRNTKMQPQEPMLMVIQGTQIFDAEEEDE